MAGLAAAVDIFYLNPIWYGFSSDMKKKKPIPIWRDKTGFSAAGVSLLVLAQMGWFPVGMNLGYIFLATEGWVLCLSLLTCFGLAGWRWR